MSEPMSNREIEDVLSSIRRLVSDDRRPVSRPSNGVTTQVTQPDTALGTPAPLERAADKLLLTPDFRVLKTPTPMHDLAPDSVIAPKAAVKSEGHGGAEGSPARFDIHDHYEWLTDPDNEDWHSASTSGSDLPQAPAGSSVESDELSSKSPLAAEASAGIEDVVSRLGAAVQASDDEWEAPMGDADVLSVGQKPAMDDGTIAAPELTFVPRARSQATSVDVMPTEHPVGTQSASDAIGTPIDTDTNPHVVTNAKADTHSAPGIDTDLGLVADTGIDTDTGINTDTGIDTDIGIDTEAEAFSTAGHDPAEDVDHNPEAVHPFARRIVTPPDADEADWADAAEAAVMEDLARDVEREAADLFDESEVGMTFDEEVLRDLVRDIIREELAGTLGERITRNVRKLVRAEIARALAVREFE